MALRKVTLAIEEFYHLYNRGTDKRKIFNDELDYQRFEEMLFLSNTTFSINVREIRKNHTSIYEFERGEPLVHIGAYCLMPNHFHILVTPARERGIERFMSKLCTGYSMYFNKKYERSGHLFQGNFKSEHADTDEYLRYLFAYIHLNPVKLIQSDWKEAGIRNLDEVKAFLAGYTHSSYLDAEQHRQTGLILSRKNFPEYFLTKREIDEELTSWLTYQMQ